MEKLLLIDGHSILNRAYYALPPMTSPKGIHTNAVYGFINIMFKYIEAEKPDYFAAAFDEKGPTFRHNLYKEYKGTRKGADPEFREQVPIIQEMLTAMGIPVIKQAGIEADDILGTIAKETVKKGLFVTVISGDRDLLQLCEENLKISIPKTKKGVTETEEYLEKDVILKMGVTPSEYIDVKALMGDSSDNIPGVFGIGEKGAFSIIKKYKSIEEAYAHVDEITPKRSMEALKEHYETAVMSKILATIKTDCELSFDLESARYESPFTSEARALCEELGLKAVLKRFPKDILNEENEGNLREETVKETKVVATAGEAVSFLSGIESAPYFGLKDNGGVDYHGFTVTFGDKASIIDTDDSEKELFSLLELTKGVIVTFGLKGFLAKVSDFHKLPVDRFFDVEIARYLIDPTRSSYELESAGKGAVFQASECENSFESLVSDIKSFGMEKLFYDMEMPLIFTLAGMEREGIYLDTKALQEYNDELKKAITRFENEIYGECGEIFNLNSPKQLGEVLFSKMGIPGGKKTKSGYSTAADVLEKLAPDYPVIEKILLYRQYAKLKSTYGDGLMDCVSMDDRVHTTFQQTVTATGRLSSTNPNLQNIPIRTELGRQIRKVFKPKPGYVFVDADYSQIELRVLAHMSGDEHLIAAYKAGDDIHRSTAAKVFNKPYEEVTDLDRSNAKAVNFGIVYGISSFGLGEDLNIGRAEAKRYIEDYYKAYPTLKEYLDNLVARAKVTGYAYTMFGRRRPIPELKASNFMQRSFGERVAMNTPIQGSAADIIKIAMIKVDKRLREGNLDAKLILQVHDELIIEARASEAQRVSDILKEEMEGAVELLVPLISEVHTGDDWYSAK